MNAWVCKERQKTSNWEIKMVRTSRETYLIGKYKYKSLLRWKIQAEKHIETGNAVRQAYRNGKYKKGDCNTEWQVAPRMSVIEGVETGLWGIV